MRGVASEPLQVERAETELGEAMARVAPRAAKLVVALGGATPLLAKEAYELELRSSRAGDADDAEHQTKGNAHLLALGASLLDLAAAAPALPRNTRIHVFVALRDSIPDRENDADCSSSGFHTLDTQTPLNKRVRLSRFVVEDDNDDDAETEGELQWLRWPHALSCAR